MENIITGEKPVLNIDIYDRLISKVRPDCVSSSFFLSCLTAQVEHSIKGEVSEKPSDSNEFTNVLGGLKQSIMGNSLFPNILGDVSRALKSAEPILAPYTDSLKISSLNQNDDAIVPVKDVEKEIWKRRKIPGLFRRAMPEEPTLSIEQRSALRSRLNPFVPFFSPVRVDVALLLREAQTLLSSAQPERQITNMHDWAALERIPSSAVSQVIGKAISKSKGFVATRYLPRMDALLVAVHHRCMPGRTLWHAWDAPSASMATMLEFLNPAYWSVNGEGKEIKELMDNFHKGEEVSFEMLIPKEPELSAEEQELQAKAAAKAKAKAKAKPIANADAEEDETKKKIDPDSLHPLHPEKFGLQRRKQKVVCASDGSVIISETFYIGCKAWVKKPETENEKDEAAYLQSVEAALEKEISEQAAAAALKPRRKKRGETEPAEDPFQAPPGEGVLRPDQARIQKGTCRVVKPGVIFGLAEDERWSNVKSQLSDFVLQIKENERNSIMQRRYEERSAAEAERIAAKAKAKPKAAPKLKPGESPPPPEEEDDEPLPPAEQLPSARDDAEFKKLQSLQCGQFWISFEDGARIVVESNDVPSLVARSPRNLLSANDEGSGNSAAPKAKAKPKAKSSSSKPGAEVEKIPLEELEVTYPSALDDTSRDDGLLLEWPSYLVGTDWEKTKYFNKVKRESMRAARFEVLADGFSVEEADEAADAKGKEVEEKRSEIFLEFDKMREEAALGLKRAAQPIARAPKCTSMTYTTSCGLCLKVDSDGTFHQFAPDAPRSYIGNKNPFRVESKSKSSPLTAGEKQTIDRIQSFDTNVVSENSEIDPAPKLSANAKPPRLLTLPPKFGECKHFVYFGCPEDIEVSRSHLRNGVVIRRLLSGRLEMFSPDGTCSVRNPTLQEVKKRKLEFCQSFERPHLKAPQYDPLPEFKPSSEEETIGTAPSPTKGKQQAAVANVIEEVSDVSKPTAVSDATLDTHCAFFDALISLFKACSFENAMDFAEGSIDTKSIIDSRIEAARKHVLAHQKQDGNTSSDQLPAVAPTVDSGLVANIAVLSSPFGNTSLSDQSVPGHWLIIRPDGSRFGRFDPETASVALPNMPDDIEIPPMADIETDDAGAKGNAKAAPAAAKKGGKAAAEQEAVAAALNEAILLAIDRSPFVSNETFYPDARIANDGCIEYALPSAALCTLVDPMTKKETVVCSWNVRFTRNSAQDAEQYTTLEFWDGTLLSHAKLRSPVPGTVPLQTFSVINPRKLARVLLTISAPTGQASLHGGLLRSLLIEVPEDKTKFQVIAETAAIRELKADGEYRDNPQEIWRTEEKDAVWKVIRPDGSVTHALPGGSIAFATIEDSCHHHLLELPLKSFSQDESSSDGADTTLMWICKPSEGKLSMKDLDGALYTVSPEGKVNVKPGIDLSDRPPVSPRLRHSLFPYRLSDAKFMPTPENAPRPRLFVVYGENGEADEIIHKSQLNAILKEIEFNPRIKVSSPQALPPPSEGFEALMFFTESADAEDPELNGPMNRVTVKQTQIPSPFDHAVAASAAAAAWNAPPPVISFDPSNGQVATNVMYSGGSKSKNPFANPLFSAKVIKSLASNPQGIFVSPLDIMQLNPEDASAILLKIPKDNNSNNNVTPVAMEDILTSFRAHRLQVKQRNNTYGKVLSADLGVKPKQEHVIHRVLIKFPEFTKEELERFDRYVEQYHEWETQHEILHSHVESKLPPPTEEQLAAAAKAAKLKLNQGNEFKGVAATSSSAAAPMNKTLPPAQSSVKKGALALPPPPYIAKRSDITSDFLDLSSLVHQANFAPSCEHAIRGDGPTSLDTIAAAFSFSSDWIENLVRSYYRLKPIGPLKDVSLIAELAKSKAKKDPFTAHFNSEFMTCHGSQVNTLIPGGISNTDDALPNKLYDPGNIITTMGSSISPKVAQYEAEIEFPSQYRQSRLITLNTNGTISMTYDSQNSLQRPFLPLSAVADTVGLNLPPSRSALVVPMPRGVKSEDSNSAAAHSIPNNNNNNNNIPSGLRSPAAANLQQQQAPSSPNSNQKSRTNTNSLTSLYGAETKGDDKSLSNSVSDLAFDLRRRPINRGDFRYFASNAGLQFIVQQHAEKFGNPRSSPKNKNNKNIMASSNYQGNNQINSLGEGIISTGSAAMIAKYIRDPISNQMIPPQAQGIGATHKRTVNQFAEITASALPQAYNEPCWSPSLPTADNYVHPSHGESMRFLNTAAHSIGSGEGDFRLERKSGVPEKAGTRSITLPPITGVEPQSVWRKAEGLISSSPKKSYGVEGFSLPFNFDKTTVGLGVANTAEEDRKQILTIQNATPAHASLKSIRFAGGLAPNVYSEPRVVSENSINTMHAME